MIIIQCVVCRAPAGEASVRVGISYRLQWLNSKKNHSLMLGVCYYFAINELRNSNDRRE